MGLEGKRMYKITGITGFKMIDRATEKVILEGDGGNIMSFSLGKTRDEFSVGDVVQTRPQMHDGYKAVCKDGYPEYIDFFRENGLQKYQNEYAYESVPKGIFTILAIGKHSSNKGMTPVYMLRSHDNEKIYLMSNHHQEMELIKKVEIKKEDSNMAEDMYTNNESVRRPMVAKPKPEIREITYKATRRPFVEVSKTTGQVVKDTSFTLPELKEKVIYSDRAVIVFLDDGSKGVAKCHPNDAYNPTTGVKIAYTRAKIKSMQKELKKLCKPDGE